MAREAYLSLDPGNKGAYCLLIPSRHYIEFYTLEKPIRDIANWLVTQVKEYDPVICIEQVRNIHGVSSKSNFNFGYNYGYQVGVLDTLFDSIYKVQPKEWQKYLGIESKGSEIKKEVAKKILDIYPLANIYGQRGGLHDGKSDSLAIAHWAYRNLNV